MAHLIHIRRPIASGSPAGTPLRRPGLIRIDTLLWLVALLAATGALLKPRTRLVQPAPLLERPIAEIELDRTRMDQTIEWIAQSAGVKIAVDWAAMKESHVARDAPVSLRLRHVTLGAALDQLPLGRHVVENDPAALRITTAEVLPVEMRIYDVRDIADWTTLWYFGPPIADPTKRKVRPPEVRAAIDHQEMTEMLARSFAVDNLVPGSSIAATGPGVILLSGPRRDHEVFKALLARIRASHDAYPWKLTRRLRPSRNEACTFD